METQGSTERQAEQGRSEALVSRCRVRLLDDELISAYQRLEWREQGDGTTGAIYTDAMLRPWALFTVLQHAMSSRHPAWSSLVGFEWRGSKGQGWSGTSGFSRRDIAHWTVALVSHLDGDPLEFRLRWNEGDGEVVEELVVERARLLQHNTSLAAYGSPALSPEPLDLVVLPISLQR